LQEPNAPAWNQTYAYDRAGRLTNSASAAGVFGYSYDAVRRVEPNKLLLPNGAYITNGYDPNARLVSTVLKNGTGATVDDYYYGYNTAGQRVVRVLAADVRKWDTDGGSGVRLDIFPSSKPLSPQAERADGSARAAG
jgi:YD repeat-containing protein